MGLNLESEQRLTKVGLVSYFHANEASWLAAAKDCYAYVVKSFPPGATIRPDDVAKVLNPAVAVNQSFITELDKKKLTQKFWVAYFVDLVLDRCWNQLP